MLVFLTVCSIFAFSYHQRLILSRQVTQQIRIVVFPDNTDCFSRLSACTTPITMHRATTQPASPSVESCRTCNATECHHHQGSAARSFGVLSSEREKSLERGFHLPPESQIKCENQKTMSCELYARGGSAAPPNQESATLPAKKHIRKKKRCQKLFLCMAHMSVYLSNDDPCARKKAKK